MRPNVRIGIKPCPYIFHLPYRNALDIDIIGTFGGSAGSGGKLDHENDSHKIHQNINDLLVKITRDC
jgi:hypothetical protein